MHGVVSSLKTLKKLILHFDIYRRGKFWGVNVGYESPENFPYDLASREYLDEDQYQKIADWCNQTFDTRTSPNRVRRMAFADYWFTSKRDLDWFILYWSGVDSEAF